MRTFTIGDFRVDVLEHTTLRPADGVIRERFLIDAFYLGEPLDWHPGELDRADFPGVPNRTYYGFTGREVVPVFENQGTEEDPRWVQVGTKRGADYRGRFWRNLVYSAGKAVRAKDLSKRKGGVTEADIDAPENPVRDATRGRFTEPVDLRTLTLDGARDALTREDAGDGQVR